MTQQNIFPYSLVVILLGAFDFRQVKNLTEPFDFFFPLRHFYWVFWRCLPTFSLIRESEFLIDKFKNQMKRLRF